MKVKIIAEESPYYIQMKINQWLESFGEEKEVIDIKYTANNIGYYAMIIYK